MNSARRYLAKQDLDVKFSQLPPSELLKPQYERKKLDFFNKFKVASDDSNSVIKMALESLKSPLGTEIIEFVIGMISEWVPSIGLILNTLKEWYESVGEFQECFNKVKKVFNPDDSSENLEPVTANLEEAPILRIESQKTPIEQCKDSKKSMMFDYELSDPEFYGPDIDGQSDHMTLRRRIKSQSERDYFLKPCDQVGVTTIGILDMMKNAWTITKSVWDAMRCVGSYLLTNIVTKDLGRDILAKIVQEVLGTAAAAVLGAMTAGVFTALKIAYFIVKLGIKIYDTYTDYLKNSKVNMFKIGECIARGAGLAKSIIGARRRKFRRNKK